MTWHARHDGTRDDDDVALTRRGQTRGLTAAHCAALRQPALPGQQG
jgi:hypothetical protein